ncbi:MAG: MinD/ParA family protein [Leptospiraceae bacterium]|nr:MinD/ParA family protein [Leptospiraceae bacterium]
MDQAAGLRKLREDIPFTKTTPKRTSARIIAVTSGKGGVGKTTFAVNLAISLAKEKQKVLVLDGDLGLANINVVLGIIPKFTLYHVIRGNKNLREIILQTPDGIDIVPGANGYAQLADLDSLSRENLIRDFSELDDYDFIIIDTGAGISVNVISLVLAADEGIIVTTPEPTSITDSYGLIKSITQKNKDFPLKVVINKAKDELEGKKVAKRVIDISQKFLNVQPHELGIIYKDEDVEKSILAQKPFMINNPRSKASECMMKICHSLLHSQEDEGEAETMGLGGYLRKFFNLSDANRVTKT